MYVHTHIDINMYVCIHTIWFQWVNTVVTVVTRVRYHGYQAQVRLGFDTNRDALTFGMTPAIFLLLLLLLLNERVNFDKNLI